LANEYRPGANARETNDLERLKQRVEIMDDRLDNIDSVLTAVAERIMKQPISITLVCPHCGKNIEVALVGQQKPT
jgi:hypothetical protein